MNLTHKTFLTQMLSVEIWEWMFKMLVTSDVECWLRMNVCTSFAMRPLNYRHKICGRVISGQVSRSQWDECMMLIAIWASGAKCYNLTNQGIRDPKIEKQSLSNIQIKMCIHITHWETIFPSDTFLNSLNFQHVEALFWMNRKQVILDIKALNYTRREQSLSEAPCI